MDAPPLVEVDSKIVVATVYSELAHVTRRASTQVPAGASRIWLRGLPSSLDPGRVRVRTSLGQVRAVEVDEIRRPRSEGARPATASLDALAERVYRLRGERDALTEEQEALDLLNPDPTTQGGALRPDIFLAGLQTLLARRSQTVAALRQVDREVEQAEEALTAERHRLESAGHTADRAEAHTALLVTLDSAQAGPAEIDVTYAVGWATWRPYYQLRLDKAAQRVEVQRLADVWQETGEDWSELELWLSTAEPEAGLRLPEVRPWRLEKRARFEDKARYLYEQRALEPPGKGGGGGGDLDKKMEDRRPSRSAAMAPPAPPAAKPAPSGLMSRMRRMAKDQDDSPEMAALEEREAEGAGDFDEVTPEVDLHPSEVEERPAAKMAEAQPQKVAGAPGVLPRDASGGIDFELKVGGRPSQASSADPQRLPLGSATYPAKLEYLLRPAIKDHGFGRVTVVHSTEQPLLGGPGAIYVKEGYVGATRLETTPAGGKLTLDLGAETQLKCARRSRTSMKTSGLINKDDLHLVEVEIDVESFLDHPAELEIQDQVPVSTDPKVKVKLLRTNPKDAVLDEQTGIITFRVKVAPGGRLELSLSYEIEVPKDTRLIQALGR